MALDHRLPRQDRREPEEGDGGCRPCSPERASGEPVVSFAASFARTALPERAAPRAITATRGRDLVRKTEPSSTRPAELQARLDRLRDDVDAPSCGKPRGVLGILRAGDRRSASGRSASDRRRPCARRRRGASTRDHEGARLRGAGALQKFAPAGIAEIDRGARLRAARSTSSPLVSSATKGTFSAASSRAIVCPTRPIAADHHVVAQLGGLRVGAWCGVLEPAPARAPSQRPTSAQQRRHHHAQCRPRRRAELRRVGGEQIVRRAQSRSR